MTNEKRIPLPLSEIIKIRARALRKRVWFRVLTRVERACVDLTIIVVEKVRSCSLQKTLLSIVKKLEEAMSSKIKCLMHEIGNSLALKISQAAYTWGNKSAAKWATDLDFVQYLTITYVNNPS